MSGNVLTYEEERDTIDAVNRISFEYPFAASLLIYAMIERLLKIYCVNNQGITREEITDYSLGEIEHLMRITGGRFSANRNDIMHSNLFMSDYGHKSKEERHKKHLKFLDIAIDDLIDAVTYIGNLDCIFKIKREERKIIMYA